MEKKFKVTFFFPSGFSEVKIVNLKSEYGPVWVNFEGYRNSSGEVYLSTGRKNLFGIYCGRTDYYFGAKPERVIVEEIE